MRKLLLAVSFLAVMVSCNTNNEKDYAVISGKVQNLNGGELKIYDSNQRELKEVAVAADGSFNDTIRNPEGNYYLKGGNGYTLIYLGDGYNVSINADASNFVESITYTGEGKQVNDYLKEKMKRLLDFRKSSRDLFAKEEADFLKDVDTYNEGLKTELKKIDDKEFVERETKDLDYATISQKRVYEKFHGQLTGNREFKVSESFPKNEVNLENEEDFKQISSYKELVIGDFFEKAEKDATANNKELHKQFLENAEKLKAGIIRDEILSTALSAFQNSYDNSDLERISNLLTDTTRKKELEEKRAMLSKLEAGKPSPKFTNLENYDGSTTSLDDLKGKYVYVDVWATWCGPCRQEIPHLKALEEKYHNNKDLAFVSISVDKASDKDTWKKMIEGKKMGGIQLIESKDNDSFTKGYDVNGIPRFILIDKNGNIISSNAPRPSETEKLEALFKENGITK